MSNVFAHGFEFLIELENVSNKEIEKANQADKRYKAGSNAFQDIPTENHAQNHPYKVHPPQVKPCYGRHYLCSQFLCWMEGW